MNQTQAAQAITRTFDELRGAIEERQYEDIKPILADQRVLFSHLNFADSDALDLLKQAQDLTNWALTLAKVQHAHAERAYANTLQLKQVDRGYKPACVPEAEYVYVRA